MKNHGRIDTDKNWPRKPNGKIDYDAWIIKISDIWPYKKLNLKKDLTKFFE